MIIAFGAFAGGLVVGMFLAPTSGVKLRRVTRLEARRRGRWLGKRLKSTQQSILETGDETASQLKKSAAEALGRYVPDIIGDDESWQSAYTQTVTDLEEGKR